MNIHKEKCKRLKAIRKKLADGLGIDLKQRECTFEGECRGTCPKCRQEEEALNRALLGKAAAVAVSAGILLTGCQGETENTGNPGNPSGRSNIDWEKVINLDFLKGGKGEASNPEEVQGFMTPPSGEFELDGNIMMPPPEEFELEGATEVLPGEMPIDYEIAGEEILAPVDESASIYEIAGDIEPGYDESVPVYENEK